MGLMKDNIFLESGSINLYLNDVSDQESDWCVVVPD
jgi:hypothetical protein